MNRIARLAGAGIAVALCIWLYFAPHLTVRSMRLAAERGDAQALSAHVDFPALRENLKAQLAERVDNRIDRGGSGGAFGALGARLTTAIANPMIDTMVSPQALSLMFAGRGLAGDGLSAATASGIGGKRTGGGVDLPQWKAAMGYEDMNTFAVTLQPGGDSAQPAKLIFKRHRLLRWTLSAIQISAPD